MIYKLKYPIPTKDKKAVINELEIGRMKAKHLRFMPKDIENISKRPYEIIPLIGAVCNIDRKEVDELDIDDLTQLSEIIFGELGNSQSQKIGETLN